MLLCRRGAGMTAATEAALYVALRPHCIDSGTVVSGAGLVDAIMSFGADLDRDEATAIKVRWCTGGAPPLLPAPSQMQHTAASAATLGRNVVAWLFAERGRAPGRRHSQCAGLHCLPATLRGRRVPPAGAAALLGHIPCVPQGVCACVCVCVCAPVSVSVSVSCFAVSLCTSCACCEGSAGRQEVLT